MRAPKSPISGIVKPGMVKKDSAQFLAVCRELLREGFAVRFTAQGQSMQPNILSDDQVVIAPASVQQIKAGQVVLAEGRDGLRVHRMIQRLAEGSAAITRGDAGQANDEGMQTILGNVVAIERGGKQISADRPWTRPLHAARVFLRRLRLAGKRRLTRGALSAIPVFILLQLLAGAAPVLASTPVTVTQSVSVTSVSPGGQVTLTDVMINTNNAASTRTPVFTQPIPTNTTYVSSVGPAGFTCTSGAVGGTTSVACTGPGNFPANGSATLTVTVQVALGTAGQTVLNAAPNTNFTPTVAPGGINGFAVTNVVASTVTVISADLGVTQSAAPASVGPGQTITFTNTITNLNDATGGSTAAAPVMRFATPANTTFTSASGTGYTCSGLAAGGTGTETCTAAGPLVIGGTSTITIVVAVNAGVANATAITGSATVSSTTFDPNSANNTGTSTSTVSIADLSLTQSNAPASVAPGATITYTNVITNNGPATAAAPVLTFATPANTTFASDTATGYNCSGVAAGAAGTLTCTATAALANAGTATITIVVTVNAGAALGTVITGSATVTSATYDANLANNTASSTATVAGADLTISQTTSVSVVDTSVNFTYTEIATNNGPIAVPAGTLVVYQQTPPNTTLQSLTVSANWACSNPGAGGTGPIICTYQLALASGANTSANPIAFVLRVNAGTAYGTTILNSATVTSQTIDPAPSNNTSITTVLVEAAADADLALAMSAAPTPVFLSSTLTYTIQARNLGQASAAAVQVTDTIPAGTTFVSASAPAGWACTGSSTVTCALTGTLAEGASATITVTVTSPSAAGPISNTATIGSSTTDPVAANNSATVITVVQPLVCATPGKDGLGGTLTGVVNTYYPGTGTLTAGATPTVTLGPSSGAATAISVGDLLLIMQMQDALINDTNTSSYGHGTPGDPATGSTSLQSSGLFEYVTATSAVPVGGGTLTFRGTGANNGTLNTYVAAPDTAAHGQQTYQVIRVPQYTSATLSSGLVPLAWTGSVGGVLALDVASQLTLGGTVVADGLGFRGGGGITLSSGTTGANTDYVTASPAALPNLAGGGDSPAGSGVNASKGEGIAGAPHWVAPPLAAIIPSSTAISTNQAVAEGLPGGSFARGAPGNAGGGGTDGDSPTNDRNSGGGAGGNGGAGGLGGYGWNSFTSLNSTDGGFGGAAFPATTSAIVMGGGGGAGTTNNGTYFISAASNGADCGTSCTGIFSSGGAGGGIVIVHTGSAVGSGTITSNGQSTLNTLNDSTGGGGAGGTILFYANTIGALTGLTVNANGGNGGLAWSTQAPTAFSGNRHGPGGGGGGGVILLSGTPTAIAVTGGANGNTNSVQDSFGATPGQAGITATNNLITETPGAQPGAYCAGADLSVTNTGTPNPVTPAGSISYTQVVANAGPQDGLNAVFSEAIPANTTFQSLAVPTGWACNSNASILSTGNITCTDPDFASGANGTFAIVTLVNSATTFGTQIVDTANISSGTNDPNLSNNSATVTTVVGSATNSAYVTLTKTANSPTVVAGNNITYTLVMHNNGPSAAAPGGLFDTLPTNTTFVSISAPANWSCTAPTVGTTGSIACNTVAPSPTFANGATATFTLVVAVPATGVSNGTVISNTANANSPTPNPNPTAASATANVTVAGATQSDLAITSSAPATPVILGNNVTFTQVATNNGPANVAAATYTDVLPAGTTFVSLVPPAGFTCTTPAVGSTGTVTCTGPLNSGASATFPLVVQVTSSDAPGTKITNTATIGPTSNDPNTANNTASSFIFTASPSQADVSIVKTATPEPVNLNTNLTYTLTVTNNGPAVAQNVNVADPLPSSVIFTNVTATQGTCAQSGGTVSCSLGTLGVGTTVVVTINVNAATFSGSSGTVCNTVNGVPYSVCNIATVTSSTSDPDPANNSSEADSTIQATTAVQLSSFRAQVRQLGGVLLEWHTQEEIRNLGFNVYREDAQGRHRVNPSIIAGAALFVRGAKPQHGAKTYYWIDPIGTAQSAYLLEDVDLNGTRSTHGPISPDPQAPIADQFAPSKASISANAQPSAEIASPSASEVSNAPLLTQLNHLAAPALQQHARALIAPRPVPPKRIRGRFPVALDLLPALKIGVTSEGWYRLSLAQLIAAGFNPGAEPQFLQLFAEGVEQPMLVESRAGNRERPIEGIEFYGTGIDTPFSGTRVYWLVRGTQPGERVTQIPASASGTATAEDFLFTVLLEERTTYFATLLNGENQDNFFGDAVTTQPVDEQLTIAHLNPNSALQATIDVTLQGATDQQAHAVSVSLNGNPVGEMSFLNQTNVTNTFPVNSTLLQDGVNTVTLTALDGDNDISLVQSIALHYPHTYAADGNWLRASVSSGATLNVTNFTNSAIYAYDITDPTAITALTGSVQPAGNTFSLALAVPNAGPAERTLLIFSADQISAPASLTFHAPDPAIHKQQSSDIVVISHPDFVASLAPYVALRQQQGRQVTLVTIDQLFDAFNYGERSPFAIQDYLQQLSTDPAQAPQAVLLVGDASLDPRNYLGFGDFDFVPTRIIETQAFKTASDDWFSDFQQTGFATIPTGRLPVRTASDAALVVSKIVNYESGSTFGTWNQQALLIADQNVDTNFTNEATFAASDLPAALQTTSIFANTLDVNTARDQILNALNNGALLVNYTGHGATEQWSFADLLDDTSASTLTNGERLPFYLLMDCLNGFFQDVYTQSLAESLLLAPNGGAVAVWASSGFTAAPEQGTLDQAMLGILKQDPSMPIGESILGAKLGITDPDVRRTWVLFGDPSMQLQLSPSAPNRARRFLRSPIFKINNSVPGTKEGN
jgi:uncharacterized repeat protein (TIGR01451 family)